MLKFQQTASFRRVCFSWAPQNPTRTRYALPRCRNGPAKFNTEDDHDWLRHAFGDSQEAPGIRLIHTARDKSFTVLLLYNKLPLHRQFFTRDRNAILRNHFVTIVRKKLQHGAPAKFADRKIAKIFKDFYFSAIFRKLLHC